VRRYLRDRTFSHFDTIPECDRDTHTHTHTQTDTRRRHIPRLARRRAVKIKSNLHVYELQIDACQKQCLKCLPFTRTHALRQ